MGTILFEVRDHIGWVRFNRPKKLNALNADVFNELDAVLRAAADDEKVKVLVLTGNSKAFAAGADIGHMAKGGIKDAYRLTDAVMHTQERLADFPKPTIAAISGYALGGGFEVALCCDFRIGDETAQVGLPEINLGIIPGGGGTQRLPRLIPPGRAAEMIMLGEIIDAGEALSLGVLNRVAGSGGLESEVVSFAEKLMAKPAMGIRAAKTAIRKGLNMSLNDGLHMEQDLFCLLFGTHDQKEGMDAFLKKKPPCFIGE